jgi:uncharacterized protein with HEPN domain
MDNSKGDNYFASKLREDMAFIVKHTTDISIEQLQNNEVLLDSMLFRLIQISENAKRLSEEYKNTRQSIPWTAIYGLRNRIVHDYGNVDMSVVFDTLKDDIPHLLETLSKSEL